MEKTIRLANVADIESIFLDAQVVLTGLNPHQLRNVPCPPSPQTPHC